MNFTDVIFSWLVRSALLSLVILLVGSGAVLAWRQPVRRLRIIELVLYACLVAPFLGMVPRYPQLSIVAPRSVAAKPQEPPLPPAIGPALQPEVARPNRFFAPERGARPMPGAKAADSPTHALDIRPWIVATYLVGVAVALGWWLVGLIGLVRILRTATPAPPRCRELLAEISAGRGNRVRLLTSQCLKQPFASARGRAVIVLPEDLCGDERALRWCLAHEWAHVARHDFRAWLLAGLARALFFYQPLVWWLRRQLRLCQDFLADAQAAGQASQAEDYAEFLTALAAKGKWRPAALGLSMRPGKSELYRRVIMLLKNQPLEDRAPRSWTLSATAAAVVLAALTAAISLAPRAVAEEEPAVKQAAAKEGETKIAESYTLFGVMDEGPVAPRGDPSTAMIPLPAYQQLNFAGTRRHYHLSVDQQKKLQAVSQDFLAHQRELSKGYKEWAKLSPSEQPAKQLELAKQQIEEDAACRKRIEHILTKEQMAEYKHDFLRQVACHIGALRPDDNDFWKLGLSPQQRERLERMAVDAQRALAQDRLQKSQQLLAVLNPAQRRKLLALMRWPDAIAPFVFVPARNIEGPTSNMVVNSIDDPNAPFSFMASDFRGASLSCPILTDEGFRKELGPGHQQREKLLAIARQFQAAAQQAFKIYPATNEALDKLSAEERKSKRADCERKLKEIGSDANRQVAAVLGPQQWAALKKRSDEARESSLGWQLATPDDGLFRTLDLTPQQRAKLRESGPALQASSLTVARETGEKALAVLTAEQRKKLEERLDQQGW